jgi:hypothetical protein
MRYDEFWRASCAPKLRARATLRDTGMPMALTRSSAPVEMPLDNSRPT